MSNKQDALHGMNVRVWGTVNGVHPFRTPEYFALGKMGDPSQSKGDTTRITAPDPDHFDREVTVGTVPGTPERATFTVSNRYTLSVARLLRIFRDGCGIDFYAAVGKCGNPQDFQRGWEKLVFFQDGQPSTHTIENFGAFGLDETGATNENLDLTAEEYWEFSRMGTGEVADAEATGEILTIDICDDASCGDCDVASDGCQRVLATMVGVGATPGTQPMLLYSEDNGLTWNTQIIDTMFSEENISGAHCIGGDLVLITNTGNEIHFTSVDELFIGQNVWEQTTSGFVVGGEPLAIWSTDVNHTWLVGNGGYVYFTKNHKASVQVQNAGVATGQNLNDVHACSKNDILAVGNANAIILSRNGGETWEALVGPAPGENLGICWMFDVDTWFVGTGPGGSGILYKTQNGGFTWEEQDLPVTNIGEFDRIMFSSDAEGFLAYRTGGAGKILRTLSGGNEWWTLPDDKVSTLPAADYFNDLAVCNKDSNTVFAGGLDDDGAAGLIVKGEGPPD